VLPSLQLKKKLVSEVIRTGSHKANKNKNKINKTKVLTTRESLVWNCESKKQDNATEVNDAGNLDDFDDFGVHG
jgi:hypothetical protein